VLNSVTLNVGSLNALNSSCFLSELVVFLSVAQVHNRATSPIIPFLPRGRTEGVTGLERLKLVEVGDWVGVVEVDHPSSSVRARCERDYWMCDHGCAALEEQDFAVYWHLLPKHKRRPAVHRHRRDEKTEDLLPAIWKEQLLPHTFSETKARGDHFFVKVNKGGVSRDEQRK
jgi:hypothetical protein